jgi:hypothetical protein
MGTAFSNDSNEDGFFIWIEWGRLFEMGRMGTAFSNGSDENGFFNWID